MSNLTSTSRRLEKHSKVKSKLKSASKTRSKIKSKSRSITYKLPQIQPPNLNGSTRSDVNGVIKLKLFGTAYEIGYAHGVLLKNEIIEMIKMYEFYMQHQYGRPLTFFIKLACDFFLPAVKKRYREIYKELNGIANGSGVPVQYILFINSKLSVDYLYTNLSSVLKSSSASIQKKYKNFMSDSVSAPSISSRSERCSAFIATGSYTSDGNIVCAHNTNGGFIETQYFNVIIEVHPKTGYSFTMQAAPGYIFSGSDFFVTSAGIVGTETTISSFISYRCRDPVFCRIRKCMQYGDTLDDYADILVANNSGDYACAWLFGNIKTKEIMSIELGLDYHDIRRTKDGVFIGSNAPQHPSIRNLECIVDAGKMYGDIRTSPWARHNRLRELVELYRGKINAVTSSKIMSDHYDIYLKKTNASSRTICNHCELDDSGETFNSGEPPFMPAGSVDAAIVDANTASKLSFLFRFGSSCGKAFKKNEFFSKNPQWGIFNDYIKDRPSQPWIKA